MKKLVLKTVVILTIISLLICWNISKGEEVTILEQTPIELTAQEVRQDSIITLLDSITAKVDRIHKLEMELSRLNNECDE